jgi:CRISPR/Cas system-associated endonuclease Cas1
MKTLYLVEGRGLRIKRDGPSVLVIQKDSAARRVPIKEIGQVVVLGNVELQAGVLTLLGAWGVPVLFASMDGAAQSFALPLKSPPGWKARRQRELASSKEYRDKLLTWLEANRAQAELHVLKRLFGKSLDGLIDTGQRRQLYRQRVKNPLEGRRARQVLSLLRGFLRETVATAVLQSGLDPHVGFLRPSEEHALVHELAYALEPFVELQALRFLRLATSHGLFGPLGRLCRPGLRHLVHGFENRREFLQGKAEELCLQLCEFLRSPHEG